MTTTEVLGAAAELRLCQLASPALPVGAYAYSEGFETAVDLDWVHDECTARDWILGQLEYSLATLDAPALYRLFDAFAAGDDDAAVRWSSQLVAMRGTRELRLTDRHLGRALVRLLDDLGMAGAARWRTREDTAFATGFALAAVEWRLPAASAVRAYLFTWTENQVAAAVKLVPLGQTAGQRILGEAIERIPALAAEAFDVDDEDIGSTAPGAAIASALHETQYSRLFRS